MEKNKGSFAALLLAAKDKGKEPTKDESGETEESSYEGLDAASEEIISAVNASDAAALKSALKSFIELCGE